MRHVSLLIVLLLTAVSGAAQQQQPAVTFRVETNFVEVHAIVTDASGAVVRDLTRDDFEIYEDGKLQKPAAFAFVDLPVERLRQTTTGAAVVEPDVRRTVRTFDGRIYIFLLDDLHTDATRSNQVREAARAFIERYLGPDDLAAVVYSSGRQEAGQELTSSRRLLMAAIDRFQGRKLPAAGLEKLAVHLRQAADDQFLSDTAEPARTQEAVQKARAVRDPLEPERAQNARRTLDAIENAANWMADVQGRRKALLFFSEGLDYDIYDPFNGDSASAIVEETRRAIAAAQRANVNVYAVDARGLNQFSGVIDINARSDYPQLEYGTFRGFLNELLLAQESLITLSNETGGIAIVNAGDVAGGLARVVLDNSRYYLLGYYSDSSKWSRKFLKIDVRVKRPGLQVRARRGFFPPDPKAAAKAREADVKTGTSPALKAALSKPVPIGDLPVRVFASSLRGSDPLASVVVALEIDGSALRFQERSGRFHDAIEVSIVAADEKGKVQGTDRQNFEMNLMPQTFERIRTTGVRLLSRLNVPPGRYQIHVGVHEEGGAVGTVPYDLEVPEYAKAPFTLSGILLTSSIADTMATANPDPELKAILSTAPVVTRKFARAETITSFVEVYDNSRSSRDISLAMSVRDANGRNVFNARDRRTIEAPRPGSGQAADRTRGQGFTTAIPLQGLAPGAYVLRAEAASSTGASAVREIPFDVE